MIKQITVILCILLCCLLLIFSPQATQAARYGLNLWAEAVLPALFPFFILTSLLQKTGVFNAILKLKKSVLKLPASSIPIFLMSCVAGAPTGARTCSMMLQEGSLSDEHSQRYAAVFNLASPMFIAGTVATKMLKDQALIAPILLGHILSAVVLFCILSWFRPLPHDKIKPSNKQAVPFSLPKALTGSISESVEGMLRIGGTIVIFIVLVNLLDTTGVMSLLSSPFEELLLRANADTRLARAIITGAVEMTNGCNEITALNLSLPLKAALCSMTVTSGGLCILIQSMVFMRIDVLKYLSLKAIQAPLAGLLTYALCPLFLSQDQSVAVLYDQRLFSQNGQVALALLIVLALFAVALYITYQVASRFFTKKKGCKVH